MSSSTVAGQKLNLGASINIMSGIQGVAAGARATINMPVNARIHRESLFCRAIAYNAATTVITGVAGTGAVLVPVVVNGAITQIVISNGGTGYTAGSLTIVDTAGNGTGATATYTVAGGVINAITVTNGGVVGNVDPGYFITSLQHLVNGSVIRDISAARVLKIAKANYPIGSTQITSVPGMLPIFFTEPWRKIVDHDQATAWDLAGQSTYQIIVGINSNLGSPSMTGLYEFDYLRNARYDDKGVPVLFLRPINQHTFTYSVPQGQFNVTSLPVDFPIQRMWLEETGKGSVTYIELFQDGNKVFEGNYDQFDAMLKQYDFNTDIFDYSVVFDPDQRLGKALNVNNLIFRVYSAAPTTLNITVEIQKNQYS